MASGMTSHACGDMVCASLPFMSSVLVECAPGTIFLFWLTMSMLSLSGICVVS